MSNLYERCFIYSRTQQERILAANKAAGKPTPKFGHVVVNGVPKTYTDNIMSMDRAPYADSILLVKGDLRKLKYTDHEFF